MKTNGQDERKNCCNDRGGLETHCSNRNPGAKPSPNQLAWKPNNSHTSLPISSGHHKDGNPPQA